MKVTRHDLGADGEPQVDAKLSRPRAIDDALLDRTIQLFQARMGRSLSREDARQILENVGGFFRILAEWDDSDRAMPSAASAEPPTE